jgi:hypothetical protein
LGGTQDPGIWWHEEKTKLHAVLLRLSMMHNFFENSVAVVLTLLFDETLCLGYEW